MTGLTTSIRTKFVIASLAVMACACQSDDKQAVAATSAESAPAPAEAPTSIRLAADSAVPATRPGGFVIRSGDSVLLVRAPAPDDAFGYLERTLADMNFFRTHNYDVSLPDHPLFREPAHPATERDERRSVFFNQVYRADDFDAALATLGRQRSELHTALARISSWAMYDGFTAHDSLTVTLTLYGPGGSFDPDAGHITLWTNAQGAFKGGGGLHTIVHEMIHLAVEQRIARPLGLRHWERERLVDLLAQREFADLLPDYRLQGGDTAPIDRFVLGTDLAGLRASVVRYVKTTQPD